MQAYDQDYYLDLLSSYPLESLDESGVDSLFSHLGYPYYSSNLLEHGITGSVLVHLDHTALKDVGVHSVGQRLNILKTVYVLKVLSNIAIEEGHYVPPSEELQDSVMPSSQIIALLTERGQFIAISSPFLSPFPLTNFPLVCTDDRIRNLENEVQHLHVALQSLKEEALTIARTAASNGKVRLFFTSPSLCPLLFHDTKPTLSIDSHDPPYVLPPLHPSPIPSQTPLLCPVQIPSRTPLPLHPPRILLILDPELLRPNSFKLNPSLHLRTIPTIYLIHLIRPSH